MKIKFRKYTYEEEEFFKVYKPKKLLILALIFLLPFVIYATVPQIDNLITPFEDRVPPNYYTPHNTTKTFGDLVYFIDDFEYPRKLNWDNPFDIFDCSESSAYLEYKLEESGFDAAIAIDNHHAWVIVRDIKKNNKTMDYSVEATTLAISYYKARYRSHTNVYEDIYEAIDGYFFFKHRYYEFNWWNGVEGAV